MRRETHKEESVFLQTTILLSLLTTYVQYQMYPCVISLIKYSIVGDKTEYRTPLLLMAVSFFFRDSCILTSLHFYRVVNQVLVEPPCSCQVWITIRWERKSEMLVNGKEMCQKRHLCLSLCATIKLAHTMLLRHIRPQNLSYRIPERFSILFTI